MLLTYTSLYKITINLHIWADNIVICLFIYIYKLGVEMSNV